MSNTSDFAVENGVLTKYTGPGGDVVIPEGVKVIGPDVFKANKNITSVVLPDSTTKIADGAFYSCCNLVKIRFSPNITSIGAVAFCDCKTLQLLSLPDAVTSIGFSAFAGCDALVTVAIPKRVSTIGQDAFASCANLHAILIPSSVTGIQDSAFDLNKNLSQVIIPITDTVKLVLDVPKRKTSTDILSKEEFIFDVIAHEKTLGRLMVCGKSSRCIWIDSIRELGVVSRTGINYSVYDSFILNGAKPLDLKASGKLRAILYRFQYPVELTDAMRGEYVAFAKKNLKKLIAVAEEDQDPELVKALLQSGAVDNSNKKTLAKLLQASTVPEIAALVAELDKPVVEKATAPKKLEAKSAETNVISPLEQEYLARYEKLGGEKQLRKIGILPAQLPQVKLRDTEEFAPSCLVAYLLLAYGSQYINTKNYHFIINAEADTAASLLDPASLSEGLLTLFDQINAVENIPIIPSCCRYCDPKGASHLIAAFRKWDKWSEFGQRGRNAEYIGFDAMVLSDTKEAVMFVDKNNRLSNYAAIRGTDADTIRDTVLMDFGLDADGKKAYDLGSKTVVATVSKELAVELLDTAANKVIKSIPKKGTDPELAAAAAAHFSDMKKNVKKAVKARNDLLFEQFLSGASRPAPAWKASYGTNPLLHRVAELVVWKQDNDTFILTADGAIDCCGSAYEIRDDIPIAVAHPMEMSSACVLAWQRYLTSNNLKQPFAQIWEPVIDPTTISEGRYKDCMIPLYRFLKMEKHGIYVTDEDFHSEIYVELDGCNADVERIDWERHTLDPNHRFRINSISFGPYTRKANHIITYLDQITVNGRILRDDVTIADNLPQFTLAQITEFIKLATENNCTNVTALLLDYKQKTFSDFEPMEEFTLE